MIKQFDKEIRISSIEGKEFEKLMEQSECVIATLKTILSTSNDNEQSDALIMDGYEPGKDSFNFFILLI